jgi:hypothetical protein
MHECGTGERHNRLADALLSQVGSQLVLVCSPLASPGRGLAPDRLALVEDAGGRAHRRSAINLSERYPCPGHPT